MRDNYAQSLEEFTADVVRLCDCAATTFDHASTALVRSDPYRAQRAVELAPESKEIRSRCEERATQLLALEGPVAGDLRRVVSSIYIVEDLARMVELGRHVARVVLRRPEEKVLPEPLVGYFEEMGRRCMSLVQKARSVVADPDADAAMSMTYDDDAIDDIHAFIVANLTRDRWSMSTQQVVDVAVTSRFFERFADHAVSVAGRVVYLSSGLKPDAYLARLENEGVDVRLDTDIAELEERLRAQFAAEDKTV